MYSDLWFWRVAWQLTESTRDPGMFGCKIHDKSIGVKMTEGMHCFVIFHDLSICNIYLIHIYIYIYIYIYSPQPTDPNDWSYLPGSATSHSKHRTVKMAKGALWNSIHEWRNSLYIGAVDERHLLPMDMDGYGTLHFLSRPFFPKEKACLFQPSIFQKLC